MLADQFRTDFQGQKYAGVFAIYQDFPKVCAFFEAPDRQCRMIESERWHDRPALSGVVVELEEQFFASGSPALRLRQSIGVLVRLVMGNYGWKPSGKRGSVSVGKYWSRSERYVRPARVSAPVVVQSRKIRRSSRHELRKIKHEVMIAQLASKLKQRLEPLMLDPETKAELGNRITTAASDAELKELADELTAMEGNHDDWGELTE